MLSLLEASFVREGSANAVTFDEHMCMLIST